VIQIIDPQPDVGGGVFQLVLGGNFLSQRERHLLCGLGHQLHQPDGIGLGNDSGVKENIKNWEGLDKLAQDLKNIRNDSEKPEELQGEPQDKYTKEDKNKMKDLLLSLDKK